MKTHSCTMARVFTDSHHTRDFTDSYHTMRGLCLIKSVIDRLHPMIISKQKSFVYKPKLIGCYTPNDISYTKLICLFVGSEFLRSHHRLRMPSNTFWTFIVGVSKPVRVLHPREYLALLNFTRHKFLPFYSTV